MQMTQHRIEENISQAIQTESLQIISNLLTIIECIIRNLNPLNSISKQNSLSKQSVFQLLLKQFLKTHSKNKVSQKIQRSVKAVIDHAEGIWISTLLKRIIRTSQPSQQRIYLQERYKQLRTKGKSPQTKLIAQDLKTKFSEIDIEEMHKSDPRLFVGEIQEVLSRIFGSTQLLNIKDQPRFRQLCHEYDQCYIALAKLNPQSSRSFNENEIMFEAITQSSNITKIPIKKEHIKDFYVENMQNFDEEKISTEIIVGKEMTEQKYWSNDLISLKLNAFNQMNTNNQMKYEFKIFLEFREKKKPSNTIL